MSLEVNHINVLDKGYVRLISTMGSDLDVVNAARVSYDKASSLDENGKLRQRDINLLEFLWNNEHTSPFRHCALSFEVYSPLMVARQHWKYTVASTFVDDQNGWNESSRRYITEEPSFFVPEVFRSAPENSKQGSGEPLSDLSNIFWNDSLREYISMGERLYQEALKANMCAEQARLFLPAYGMYVRYRWTTSLHGVLHFLAQRLGHDAQVEIQEYAKAVSQLVKINFPESYALAIGEK